MTPFVLAYLHEHSDGETPRVNRDLIVANAGLAGEIAAAYGPSSSPMSLYDAVRDLPLEVDGYELEGLAQDVSSGFLRQTTIIQLHGGGETGVGEDVTYDGAEHDLLQAQGPDAPARRRVDDAQLLGASRDASALHHEPEQHAYLDYRRWAFESAALDLALRQAGVSLGERRRAARRGR